MDIKSLIVSKQLFGTGEGNSPGGGTVEVDIFPEQNVEGFAPDSDLGGMYGLGAASLFVLELGKEYSVEWDEDEHTCVAQDMSAIAPGAIAIGNLANFDGTGNGEPFVLVYMNGWNVLMAIDGSTATSHRIRIYQSVKTVAVAPQDISVPLNMANGDQVLTPDEGRAFSGVTIQMPETLIPENIAEGIDIAGIIGSFAAGGMACNGGKFTGNGNMITIQHGLGVRPDFFYLATLTDGTSGQWVLDGFAMSEKAKERTSFYRHGNFTYKNGSSKSSASQSSPIETENASQYIFVHHANEETIIVGNSTYVPYAYEQYWFAFGGLT